MAYISQEYDYNLNDFQVMERAKEGESLEELRARTAAQFTDHNPTKLSRKRKHMAALDEGIVKFERNAG